MDADISTHLYTTGSAFVFRPVIEQRDEKTWIARYPGADWSAAGTSADDARNQLHIAALARLGNPDNSTWQDTASREPLTHGPIPGVYELTREQNTRVDNSPDPETALEQLLNDIDAQRPDQQTGDAKI